MAELHVRPYCKPALARPSRRPAASLPLPSHNANVCEAQDFCNAQGTNVPEVWEFGTGAAFPVRRSPPGTAGHASEMQDLTWSLRSLLGLLVSGLCLLCVGWDEKTETIRHYLYLNSSKQLLFEHSRLDAGGRPQHWLDLRKRNQSSHFTLLF